MRRQLLLAIGVAGWCVAAAWPCGRIRAAQAVAPAVAQSVDAQGLYDDKCSLCHGADRAGNPPAFPGLVGVTAKYSDAEITGQIKHGKGRMPAFASLSDAEVAALVALLKTPVPSQSAPSAAPAPKPTETPASTPPTD